VGKAYNESEKEKKMEIIKVAIADADTLVREGLKRILALERDLLLVGEAVDGAEIAQVLKRTSPDVLLVDLEIPKRKRVFNLLEKGLTNKVFILCSFPDQASILDAAKAGARGYVDLNRVNPSTITHAIRRIHAGEIWVDRQLGCSETFAQFARQKYSHDVNERERRHHSMLSKRQLEIISLVANGLTNEKIGQKLFISEGTVKIHLRNVFHKLGVKTRTQAALLHVQEQSRLVAA